MVHFFSLFTYRSRRKKKKYESFIGCQKCKDLVVCSAAGKDKNQVLLLNIDFVAFFSLRLFHFFAILPITDDCTRHHVENTTKKQIPFLYLNSFRDCIRVADSSSKNYEENFPYFQKNTAAPGENPKDNGFPLSSAFCCSPIVSHNQSDEGTRVKVNMCAPLSTAGMHVLTEEALQLIYAHLFIPFPRNKVGLTSTIPYARVPVLSPLTLFSSHSRFCK